MRDISAICLFCEDIREEKNGGHTLIGILGDNVNVPVLPGAMPKLAIYVRIHVSVDFDPIDLEIALRSPDGNEISLAKIEKTLIEKTISESRAAGNPIAGLFSQIVASPFQVHREGRISLELKWGQDSIFLGSLNFTRINSTDSPNP